MAGKVTPIPAGDALPRPPFGHIWHVSTHTEDLSEEELRKRAAQAAAQKA